RLWACALRPTRLRYCAPCRATANLSRRLTVVFRGIFPAFAVFRFVAGLVSDVTALVLRPQYGDSSLAYHPWPLKETKMDEQRFNMSMRKFLKEVGVTSQQEIERVVREEGLGGKGVLKVKMVLTGEGTGLRHVVEGEIDLGETATIAKSDPWATERQVDTDQRDL